MPRSLLARLAAALLLVACSNSTEPGHNGSMAFDYHGSLPDAPHGTFDVVGSRKFAAQNYPTGAGGFISTDGPNTIIDVTGSQHDGPQLFDIVFAGPPALGPVPMCLTPTTPTSMCVVSGYWQTGPLGGSHHNFGSQASFDTPRPVMHVTITALTNDRITATFEGIAVGTCATCALAGSADTVTFINGRFDVPYR
ncbi:MAG: hypothetical protein ACJ79K_17930 [Gemmatimonadaceae bacterium]